MGPDTVVFSWVLDAEASSVAYAWYKAFAKDDPHIFPRGEKAYRKLLDAGQVVSAMASGEVVGLTYYTFDDDTKEWELGGLMVGKIHHNKGIGSVLARVALGHLLFEEDPFGNGQTVVSHVHADNQAPRNLLKKLGFEKRRSVEIPGSKLPGLKTNDKGMVTGDELELSPDSLKNLSQWCDRWSTKLKDGTRAQIELGEAITLKHWSRAFEVMSTS